MLVNLTSHVPIKLNAKKDDMSGNKSLESFAMKLTHFETGVSMLLQLMRQ